MNNQTDDALSALNAESTSLKIGDDTLLLGDMQVIASKVGQAPSLITLEISNCNLNEDLIKPLLFVLPLHPSLREVRMPYNKFKKVDFVEPLIVANPRFHTFDFSNNRDHEGFFVTDYLCTRDLMDLLIRQDTIVNLAVTGTPVLCYFGGVHAAEAELGKAKNILTFKIKTNVGDNDRFDMGEMRDVIKSCCQWNKREAERMIERVCHIKTLSADDVTKINERLPAIVYLAEQSMGRPEMIRALSAFHAKALKELGVQTKVGVYVPEAAEVEKDAMGAIFVPSSFAPSDVEPTRPVFEPFALIESMVQQLPSWQEADVRQALATCRQQDLRSLMGWGDELVDAVNGIALASAQVSAHFCAQPSISMSVVDFSEKMARARALLAQYVVQAQEGSQKKRSFKLFRKASNLTALTEIADLANDGIQILHKVLPGALSMENRIGDQLSASHLLVQAYKRVGRQICLFIQVGQETLADWLDQTKADVDISAPNGQAPSAGENPSAASLLFPKDDFWDDGVFMSAKILQSRVDSLQQLRDLVKVYVGLHDFQRQSEHAALQGVAPVRQSHASFLAEQTSGFARQIHLWRQVATVERFSSASKEVAGACNPVLLTIAQETLASIDKITAHTQELLSQVSKGAQQWETQRQRLEKARQRFLEATP